MKFHFKAINRSGDVFEGDREAKDKFDLYRDLKIDGSTVISVSEPEGAGIRFSRLNSIVGTVSLREKIAFARSLGSMMEAGLSLSRALSVLERQSRNPKFKEVKKKPAASINRGDPLHKSLSEHGGVFPPLFTAMVKAGEESGGLSSSLKIVSEQLERSYLLKKRIQGAMIYPAIVISAMFVIGALMMIYVVPTLTETFKEFEIELPASTRFVILVSDFLANYAYTTLAVIVFLGFFGFYFSRTGWGKKISHFILLRLPVAGVIFKEVQAARTCRTLSSLLSSGVEVVFSLSITKDVLQSPYYKEVLEEAGAKVQKGVSLSNVFSSHENLYPILVGEMMSVGEETGKITEMLFKTADFYENEVEQKTKNISTIVEPLLMVLIGSAVGFFAFSMISPIYSLSNSI